MLSPVSSPALQQGGRARRTSIRDERAKEDRYDIGEDFLQGGKEGDSRKEAGGNLPAGQIRTALAWSIGQTNRFPQSAAPQGRPTV